MPDLPERSGYWKRVGLGALLIVAACAAATAVAAIHQVDRIAAAFKGDLKVDNLLAKVEPGKPQTILLIGSDKRAKGAVDRESQSRSDTMILMRLDSDREAIALMSLPRDLKVRIPGHGKDKLNTAYAIGGTKLLLRTIKQVTGLRINQVINVDFGGFRDAVNEIGCVYTDVDRRYFNDNSGPVQYATIDIDPGYQKLCGKDALDYVRYRHTDTDIVRAARQQDFLRQAKSQAGTGKLISKQEKLIKIVSKYTRSTIQGRTQVLTLLKLAIGTIGDPVHEVHFPARVGASYVTASEEAVKKATREFLGVTPSKGPRGDPKPRDGSRRRSRSRLKLIDISGQGHDEALEVAKDARGMAIYYPRRGVPGSTYSINSPRSYRICGPNGGKCYSSYRIVLSRDLVGEYYGLQGTTWKDPPILKSPNEIREVGGRKLMIFTDGDRVRLIAWRTKDATYWVSNTLLQTISKREMIAIARAAKPLS